MMDRRTKKGTAPRSGQSRLKQAEVYASSKHEAIKQLCEEEAIILEMLEKVKLAKNKLLLERLALINELKVTNPNMSQEEQDAIINSNTNSDVPSIHTTANPPTANQPTANQPTANPPTANQPTANPPSASRPTLPSASKTSNIYPECRDPGLTGNNSDELSASLLERMVGGEFYADTEEQPNSSNHSSMTSECGDAWVDELMKLF